MIFKELLQDMDRAQREMFRWMDAPLGQGAAFPLISIYRNEEGLLLQADVPGVGPEQVDISIANDVVTISGKVPGYGAEKEVKDSDQSAGGEGDANAPESSFSALRRERFSGEFSRTIELPVEVDSAKAQAKVKDGVLELILPLREERKPRKVSVTGA